MGSENKIFWLENEIFGMENEDNNPHGKKGLVELKIFVKVMGQKMIFYGQKMEVFWIKNELLKQILEKLGQKFKLITSMYEEEEWNGVQDGKQNFGTKNEINGTNLKIKFRS